MGVARLADAAGEVDGQTIAACRRGDQVALTSVFLSVSPMLERLLRRLVGPGADVEDLLQDTFEAAIAAFPKFRGKASVQTWMARIAVHVAHDHLRRPDRRRAVALELVEAADRTPQPERMVASRSALERVYHHLAALSPKQRIAFMLHVVEQRPIAEVAALMSATKAATKSRVWLARRAVLKRARHDPTLRELLPDPRGGDSCD